ncbi:sugar transferase [uncultured Sphingomonas sp.]|uniref:sugar transferase n=1 Tax=uncultured Sphingomonas sp. TaxID=158754 RepID=UPI002606F59B|nr:sugar transferase [uncultured Sphingomonas sp.]
MASNNLYRRHGSAYRWARLRCQLPVTLLLAAVIPYLARYVTVSDPLLLAALSTTFAANIICIGIGIWLFRSVSDFPGVEASSYILPAFSIAYAFALLVLLFGRIDYNRGLLLVGFILAVLCSYFIYSRMQRRRLRIGFVPIGAGGNLRVVKAVDWVVLDDPTLPLPRVDAVAADLRVNLPDSWERRLADIALSGTPVYHWKHLAESLTGRVELEHLSENNFGSLTPASAYMSIKHAVDWIFAGVALLLLSPFLLLLLLAIRLDSPGAPIFRQTRVGYQGHPFTVYKLRTMSQGRATGDARRAAMTSSDDLRVTRLGALLRRSRIDELPQLINVLRGEMSWIGPRPEAEILSKWYEDEIVFYRYRHIVRPGITGWAQVNQGHVAEVDDVRSKLHYDFFYIRNYSPWLDLLIVVRTIVTMLNGFGAR